MNEGHSHAVAHGFYVLDSLQRFVAWVEHAEDASRHVRETDHADTAIRVRDGALIAYRGGKAFGRGVSR